MDQKMEELLTAALLRGDRDAVLSLTAVAERDQLRLCKSSVLHGLTEGCLKGDVPFCQLTAAAQAAAALEDGALPPVACCGAVEGNTSATGQHFLLMLLRAWGMPALDLGCSVAPDRFLDAVVEHVFSFVLCTLFSPKDMESVRRLDAEARRCGLRDRFLLVVSGAEPGPDSPADFQSRSAAAAAEWVVSRWRS